MAEALTEKMQPPAPLVALTDDEQMFRDNVRQFADEKVRPLVRKMDEEQVLDRDLIRQFFDLGLMGIEIPEQYGGGSGTFFEAILAPAVSAPLTAHLLPAPPAAFFPSSFAPPLKASLPTPVTSNFTSSYWQVLVSWYSSTSR